MSRIRRIAVVLLVAVGTLALLWLTVLRGGDGERDLEASGTVEATEAILGFQTPGRIEAIAVQEGDTARAGQELAWLDRAELQARLDAVRAQARAARAQLAELTAGSRREEVDQARAALRAAEQRLLDARRDLDRTRRLYEGGAVSREAFERAETGLAVAEAQHEQATDQLRLLEQGPRAERIAAQRALAAQAEAAVSQAEASLRHAAIRAPMDGVVTVRHREPGETVPAGGPVLTLMNPDDRWVRIYIRADAVGRVSLGQRAVITADTYRHRAYGGEVSFIASEAEFTPRNVQTTEERVKLVYAVKVRITDDPTFDLKPGLAADVRLEPREGDYQGGSML